MNDDARTIWCGNLSSKCTEEILSELFLQAGPLEKVHIPKDRDGHQKNFGFVTYKHAVSVPYALDLFEGTAIYNRILIIKTRQVSNEQPQVQQTQNLPSLLNISNQMMMGYGMPNLGLNMMLPLHLPPELVSFNLNNMLPRGKEERHSNRHHPYGREHNRERSGRDRGNRPDRGHRSHDYYRSFRSHGSSDYRSRRYR